MERTSWRASFNSKLVKLKFFDKGKDENRNKTPEENSSTVVTNCNGLNSEVKKNEDPEQLEKNLQTLRELIRNDDTLNVPLEDIFLLRFLRSMDYDCKGAYELVHNYYKLQVDYPEIYVKVRPSEVLNAFENNMLTLLPQRDQHGRRIFVYRTGVWEPENCSVFDGYRGIQLCLEMAVRDEETQKNGVVIITDWKGFGLRHAKYFRPSYVKIGITLIQESFPARFAAFHIINEHAIYEVAFMIIKPFLREDFKNRMHLHGSNWESLHKHISPEILPVEYGGTQPPLENSSFIRNLITCDDEFAENSKYGYKKNL